jgi:hypothetical protein
VAQRQPVAIAGQDRFAGAARGGTQSHGLRECHFVRLGVGPRLWIQPQTWPEQPSIQGVDTSLAAVDGSRRRQLFDVLDLLPHLLDQDLQLDR